MDWGKLEPFVRLLLLSVNLPPPGSLRFHAPTKLSSKTAHETQSCSHWDRKRIAKSKVLVFPLYGRAVLPMKPVVELLSFRMSCVGFCFFFLLLLCLPLQDPFSI